ncbi:MAG: response regulator [Vicinamibacterales bacterium]
MAKRIVLAEDDRFLRRACETKLRQCGFEVHTAVDGDEAVTVTKDVVPDLLLLDLLMPKRDGLGVLRALREHEPTKNLTVVILSNSSKELEMKNAASLGAAAYWVKANMSLQELCEKVKELLEP